MNHSKLFEHFIVESGISPELASECGFEPHTAAQMAVETGYIDYEGVRIPYPTVEGDWSSYARFRFLGKSGKHKYHTRKGEKTRLYYPPNGGPAFQKLARTPIPIYIVEGEKKAIAWQQRLNGAGKHGLVLGLSGIWNFTATKNRSCRFGTKTTGLVSCQQQDEPN